jgi:hypothetical protein
LQGYKTRRKSRIAYKNSVVQQAIDELAKGLIALRNKAKPAAH